MMRFDRFTERAQEAAQRAAEIIQRYGHNQIDTEHILLALIEQPGGVIPQILEKLSVSGEALNERLDATLRAILRAAAYEVMFMENVPARVAITEYLDVAHAFFDEQEPKLLNGVLNTLARQRRPEEF